MSKILVGVDGSENAADALRWASARSARVGGQVVAVMAWTYIDQGHRDPGEELETDFSGNDARKHLDAAIETAAVSGEVSKRVVNSPAAEALVKLAGPDDLIVVGARGLGGFKGLLLGSVSMRVLELAPCPVVVLHDEVATIDNDAAVVVGIDGSEASIHALQWAATEAATRGVPVRIVHAWTTPAYAGLAGPVWISAMEETALEVISAAIAALSLEGLTIERDVAHGSPASALLDHDANASMIVVASRGKGFVKRVLLGSTSRQVAQHATVPVVVVPAAE